MSRMTIGVLTDADIERLHAETLRVLSEVGFKLTHDEALQRFQRAGARVSEGTGNVRLPAELVLELLSHAPAEMRVSGVNGRELSIGGASRHYSSLIIDPVIVDHWSGPRAPVLEDVRRHTIVGESLDRVDILMRMEYPVADIPEPDSCYKTMEVFLLHATKHISIYPDSEKNCRDWLEVMARISEARGLGESSPSLLSVAMAVTSPLQVHGANIEIMKMAMEHGCPILTTVCPMAGTTAPYSLAGTLLLANAEALIPVLIAQLYRPGHPVSYGMGPSVTDMRNGYDLYYKTEKMLFKTAAAQLGAFYNLPISGEAGGTLTWRADVQNGAESFAYLLASHAGRQNIIGGLGSLHNANGMSAEQIVMQCGLVDMAEYLVKGIDLSPRKLAFDAIRNVGPGGNFLQDELTVDMLHSDEFFNSEFIDLSGGHGPSDMDMLGLARRKTRDLVDQYSPAVPESVQETVREYFRGKYRDKRLAE